MFIIMVKKLQSDTDSAVQYLINSIKNMKISNIEGENVSRVVSLVRGAHKRLKGVGVSKVPEEFPKWVLLLMQTSTVSSFNEAFAHLQREVEVGSILRSGSSKAYPPIEDVLRVAEKLYLDKTSTNEWSGLTSKGNSSSFPAVSKNNNGKGKPVTCWNCGGEGHGTRECTKPLNAALVEQRKKLYKENKKKERKERKDKKGDKKSDDNKKTPTGKWAPPSEAEKNKRVIDGKPMYWANRTKRWINDKQAGAAPTAHPAIVPPAPSGQSVPSNTGAPNSTSDSARTIAITNATHSINMAMQGLLGAFKEA